MLYVGPSNFILEASDPEHTAILLGNRTYLVHPRTGKGSPGVTYSNAKTRLTRLTHRELQIERPGGILNLLCVCATCTGTDWKLAEGGVDPSTVARDLDIVDLPAGTHIVCMHNLNYFYCIATSAIV